MVMVRDYKGVTMQKMTATFSRWFALALLLMALPALAKAQSQSPEQMIRDNIEVHGANRRA